jgi:branched-chain amino acid transport system substrate-binding protein
MTKSKHEFRRNFAVIIGINKYKFNIPKLKTAVPDAKTLTDLLKERYKDLKEKYQEPNKYEVLLLTDEQATKQNLNKLLNSFKAGKIWLDEEGKEEETVHTDDRLLFYFAGHGYANPRNPELRESYFLPQDAEYENFSSYLKMQELYDALKELKCRHMLVILDCCFAGAFHYVVRDPKKIPIVYKETYDYFIQHPAWYVITSAAYNQQALDNSPFGEREPKQDGEHFSDHSPFAKALFEALSGKSNPQNADVNKDNIIIVTELYLYLQNKFIESVAKNEDFPWQTPGIYPLRPDNLGQFIFLLPEFDRDKLDDAPLINKENNPYRGLMPYEEEHSDLFFGRDKTIKDLYKKVNQNTLTVVTGAPGTGKSSLVNAGLIPNWRKLNDLQKQIDDLQEKEEQLAKAKHLNDKKKDLNQLKEDLEKLEKNQENLKPLKTQEDDLLRKIREAILNQDLLYLQDLCKQKLIPDLDILNKNIEILQKQKENIKEIKKSYEQEQNNLKILDDKLKKVKSVYSFLTKTLDYLDDLHKRLKIELNQNLKEGLQKIKEQIEEALKEVIEEKHKEEYKERLEKKVEEKYKEELTKIINEKDKAGFKRKAVERLTQEIALNLLKRNYKSQSRKIIEGLEKQLNNEKASLESYLNHLGKQLETQLRWYIRKVRLGEFPIKTLNNSLDSNWLSEQPSTSNQSNLSLDKIIKEIDRKLKKWNSYHADNFSHKQLLVIDQLEELFDLCKDKNEREKFLKWLAKATENNSEWLRIVLIVRSDSEPLFQDTALKQYWTKEAQFAVPQMYRWEFQQAIEEPAILKVVNFEVKDNQNFVDDLLDEMMQMQEELPLLSFFLHELYNKLLDKNKNGCECRTFTIEDYRQLGGVKEVLNNKLESEYNNFVLQNYPEELQSEESCTREKTIRNVMLRIVTMDSYLSRPRVSRSELQYPQPGENKRIDKVIEAFVNAHFLVKEQNEQKQYIIEPAQDMVLQWRRLKNWAKKADEDVPFSLRQRLMQNVLDWKNEKDDTRKQNYLWRNFYDLKLLKQVSNSNDNWLNEFEDEFVKESVKQSQIELLILKAEEEYEKVFKEQLSQESIQSLTLEKTIRNVMLRMVAIDNNLPYRCVLRSELVYPDPEENKRVKKVVEDFVSAGLLLEEPENEKIYVKPVNDALMQKWERLLTWKWIHKENLMLFRQLTKATVSWQDKNKERNLLWHRKQDLDLLKKVVKVVNSNDNWLNQLENEFVNESIRYIESSNRTKLLTSLTKSRILWILPLLILPALFFWIFSSIQRRSEHQIAEVLPVPTAISSGEKIFTTPDKLTWLKLDGVKAIATGNFGGAVNLLKEYREKQPNDPEALIYLNNAIIGNGKSYTIATSVPISSDINGALEMLRGVAQAQDEINKAGGINGVPLQVLIADDDNNPNIAKQIAEKFIQDSKILGVVGHYSSDATLAAGEIYKGGKLVAISPVSTSVKLKGFSNYIFRTVPNDAVAARTLADYMLNRLGKKKAAIFYSSKSEYSQSLKKEFVSAIASTNGQLANQLVFDLSDSDFNAHQSVERAIQQRAEVLVLLANTKELDNALLVVKANHKRLPLLAGDDLYTPKVLKEGAEDVVGMIVSVPWHILAEPKSDFVKTSKEIWRGAQINWRTAMSYDATLGLISAIKQNPYPTREGIATTLLSTGFTGATGDIKFSSGERAQAVIQLVKIIKTGSSSRSGYSYDFVPVIKYKESL